jgi:hypothetical protein
LGNISKKHAKGGKTSRVMARAVRREPPRLSQLAAAVIALAVLQSERDTAAQRETDGPTETAGDAS